MTTAGRCTRQEREVCAEVPQQNCSLVTFVDCRDTTASQVVSSDQPEVREFRVQECRPGPVKVAHSTLCYTQTTKTNL